ncbi:MAG: bifunctional (p)ppGpp synthetase/guanosine-3',5'-bis(diphosphate) 3'-pyrophosphohydrolase [Bacteroidales bacterium]|nr:bifunctional (p)ppGpp synthetase/guanosine-3',5'-bis(diphosphate) 3'-pyrophosphohydrolase [Bacteroidales bacterium]
MFTQEIYQKAIKFAGEKHANQCVPGTKANYLLHLSNVAMEIIATFISKPDFDINFAVQVAILHDIIEDTDTTFNELKENFSKKIAQGVMALTKNKFLLKSEQITDSLYRIKQQPKEVGMVKLADRITNLQKPPIHWSSEKISSYLKEAKLIAESLSNKNEYLHNRILLKIDEYKKFDVFSK